MRSHCLRSVVLGSSVAALAFPVCAKVTTYKLDSRHSSAQFAVTHLMISKVRGAFHAVNGAVSVDDSDITKSSVEVTIDATTIDTREPDRDKDLKSSHFLDVAKYPTMSFKSTKVEKGTSGHLKVTGDLTIHGVTKSVVLDITEPNPPIKDPWDCNGPPSLGRQKSIGRNSALPTVRRWTTVVWLFGTKSRSHWMLR